MFREREFQTRVLTTLDHYLEALRHERDGVQQQIAAARDDPSRIKYIPDYTQFAFDNLRNEGRLPPSRKDIPFSPRRDGLGQPVPNVTMKVPTGGGKTWLAVKSASKILNGYLEQNHGFVLWIVPNEAIFSQTVKNFTNRDHPYRQALDRAAAGRVKILTKADSLNARDVETHLCIMVLMLQSAARKTKETLRMFRDRGDVFGFIPPLGDLQAHKELVRTFGGAAQIKVSKCLDTYGDELFPVVKDSLGNALRIIRPVVVMDEGHKAIADISYQTLYGFNPSFVLELTATPKDIAARSGRVPREARFANMLVEVTGLELEAEEMIKMPLMLDPHKGTDWRAVLNSAVDRLGTLQKDAEAFHADHQGRYIRPIMLVQVERTGKGQRDGVHIHAEDVCEWLLRTGFDEAEIAIKTAEQNDLKQPEKQDLLLPHNRVRVIITKEALQEGWDCPFAYVLCSLASRSNLSSMTQLVGRVLRQPHAMKTGIDALDRCYVFTHQSETRDLIEAIKTGLEKDGLGDLILSVNTEAAAGGDIAPQVVTRRDHFRTLKVYMPRVLIERDGQIGSLDYETDILTQIDWHGFDVRDVAARLSPTGRSLNRQLVEVRLAGDEQEVVTSTRREHLEELTNFDAVLAVQHISDIILNPFVARDVVQNLLGQLNARGFDAFALGHSSARIIEELRKGLWAERERQAEACFRHEVCEGNIQFRLRNDGNNWEMPDELQTQFGMQGPQVRDREGRPLQKSLFSAVYLDEMNRDERDVAVYLDGQAALGWWHRNVARKHYGLQGWRKGAIYPDFIFSVKEGGKTSKLIALETKGEHLEGYNDTEYKKAVMAFLTEHFDWESARHLGETELETHGESIVCDMVMLDDWEEEVSCYFQ